MKPLRATRRASNLAPLSVWNAQFVTAWANDDCQYPTPQHYSGSTAQLISNILMVGDTQSGMIPRAEDDKIEATLGVVASHPNAAIPSHELANLRPQCTERSSP